MKRTNCWHWDSHADFLDTWISLTEYLDLVFMSESNCPVKTIQQLL